MAAGRDFLPNPRARRPHKKADCPRLVERKNFVILSSKNGFYVFHRAMQRWDKSVGNKNKYYISLVSASKFRKQTRPADKAAIEFF